MYCYVCAFGAAVLHCYSLPTDQQLAKRTAKRAKAEAELKVATEADDKNDIDRFSKRLVRVTRDHNEDCKKLLSLMGVPVVTVSTTPGVGVPCRLCL